MSLSPEPDLISQMLCGLRMRSAVHCPMELRAPWGMAIPEPEGAGFVIVQEGRCVAQVAGNTLVELEAGDFAVITRRCACTLRSERNAECLPLWTLVEQCPPGEDGVRRGGNGGALAVLTCGSFYFDDEENPLLQSLPPQIVVRGEAGRAQPWLAPTLEFIACEARSGRPGSESIITRLSDVLFIQAVRAFLAANCEASGGWLRAATDPQLGAALREIHARPDAPWTVESLARVAALSRSAFAERFLRMVGETPLRYVTRWRMHEAARLLRGGNYGLARVATEVGYESEAAFSKAFKAWRGVSPGAFRRANA